MRFSSEYWKIFMKNNTQYFTITKYIKNKYFKLVINICFGVINEYE